MVLHLRLTRDLCITRLSKARAIVVPAHTMRRTTERHSGLTPWIDSNQRRGADSGTPDFFAYVPAAARGLTDQLFEARVIRDAHVFRVPLDVAVGALRAGKSNFR